MATKKTTAAKPKAAAAKKTAAKPKADEVEAEAPDVTAAAEGGQGSVSETAPDTPPEPKAEAPTVASAGEPEPGIDHDDKGYIGDKPNGPDDAAYALPSGPSSPSAADLSPEGAED